MEPAEPINLLINPDSTKEGDWVLIEYRKKGFLARLFVLRVMKSKFDAFRNYMVYVNLKNSNVKKMPYSTKGFSMQMSTQKWSRGGENGFGHIKNNHTVLLCTATRRKQKNIKLCTFCLSLTCPSMMMTSSLSEVTAHSVCSIYTTNFYHLKRSGSPFFQHKNFSPIFINFGGMHL